VLTPAGMAAIKELLDSNVPADMAALTDLAPEYDPAGEYEKDQLVVKDGKLQICTKAGEGEEAGAGAAEFSADASVEMSIANRIAELKEQMGVDNYVPDTVVDDEFQADRGYAVGETCTYKGYFYRCVEQVPANAPWDGSKWESITIKSLVPTSTGQEQADWTEDDVAAPSYIKHKPNIPAVDPTLSESGAAADAAAVGAALTRVSASGFMFVEPQLGQSGYQMVDRAINRISAYSSIITLIVPDPRPSAVGNHYAREFILALDFSDYQGDDVNSSITVSQWDLYDCAGNRLPGINVTDKKYHAFKFTERWNSGEGFVVTGIADHKVYEIEQAVDGIYGELFPGQEGL